MPDNTYIKNKNFGKGNSILVYDGKDYYCITWANISKLNTKKIKGKVIGFMSPIGGSDVSYPNMLTTTHIYSWCDDIFEHKLPNNKTKIKILKLLSKAKNPFDIPKKYYNAIRIFDDDYNFPYFCSKSKIKLKETTLIDCGRDGPIESATLFPIGTKKKDEYGITWEVIKGYRDINKWEEYKYYLIHNIFGKNKGVEISFVVVDENNRLKVYKVINKEKVKYEDSYIQVHNDLEFRDYTTEKNIKLIVDKEPVFTLPRFEKIYIGSDFNSNYYKVKNKYYGNSILVFDGNDYYSIISNTISKLNTKKIKGNLSNNKNDYDESPGSPESPITGNNSLLVTDFISPIDKDKDKIIEPLMFTNTHIYNFCNNNIFEYEIKTDKILEIFSFIIKSKKIRGLKNSLLNNKMITESKKYISLKEYLIKNYCSCKKSKVTLDKTILVDISK